MVPSAANVEGATDRCIEHRGGTIAEHAGVAKLGNRAGFRCPCSKELEGSSPSARTDFDAGHDTKRARTSGAGSGQLSYLPKTR